MYHIKLSKYCYIDDSIKHGHESQVLNDYFFLYNLPENGYLKFLTIIFFYIICQKMVNFHI